MSSDLLPATKRGRGNGVRKASVALERPKRSGPTSDLSPTTKRSEEWAILGSNQ
jgi:hypothetical protein